MRKASTMKRSPQLNDSNGNKDTNNKKFCSFFNPAENQTNPSIPLAVNKSSLLFPSDIIKNPLSFNQQSSESDSVKLNQILAPLFSQIDENQIREIDTNNYGEDNKNFLIAAKNGDIKETRKLWGIRTKKRRRHGGGHDIANVAALLASFNNHIDIVKFLLCGVKFMVLDREPTEEEKQAVKNGFRIFAVINKGNLPHEGHQFNLQEAKIIFRDTQSDYQTRMLNSTEHSKICPKLLSNIKVAYSNEKKSAEKMGRKIRPAESKQKPALGALKNFLDKMEGDSTGLDYNNQAFVFNPTESYTAICNAYNKMNLDLFYLWSRSVREFEPDAPLFQLQAIQQLFVLFATNGALAKIKVMAENEYSSSLLDRKTLDCAFLAAVKNEQLSVVEYLPLYSSILLLPQEEISWQDRSTSNCLFYNLIYTTSEDYDKATLGKIAILDIIKKRDSALFSQIYSILIREICSNGYSFHGIKNRMLLEYFIKEPIINPDFHALSVSEAGLSLVLQSNNVELYTALAVGYRLSATSVNKEYYERLKSTNRNEIRILAYIACEYSGSDTNFLNFSKIIRKNNLSLLISNLLATNQDILKVLIYEPLIFKQHHPTVWKRILSNDKIYDSEIKCWIEKLAIQDTCIELYKLCYQIYEQLNSLDFSIPIEIIRIIISMAIEIPPLTTEQLMKLRKEQPQKIHPPQQAFGQLHSQLPSRPQGYYTTREMHSFSFGNSTFSFFSRDNDANLGRSYIIAKPVNSDNKIPDILESNSMEVERYIEAFRDTEIDHNPYLDDIEIPMDSDESSDEEWRSYKL